MERFRNGDTTNDPTVHDAEGFSRAGMPAGWRPTPWSQDWYRQEPWARATGRDFYGTVQYRRYGGDLQGVMDRLDYLQSLGVTALYLNPVNDAPSLHKYDARNYRHIDRNFGPDPRGDERRMAAETPWDPASWTWTSADSLFLALVREVHRRGMRIIMDYSWNHTGTSFWAWQDILKNQQKSRFADWYEIERFDDPATPDTSEFSYRGWVGVKSLPEWKKVGRPAGQTRGPIEGNLVRPVSGTSSSALPAAGWIPTTTAIHPTALTGSAWTSPTSCHSASGATTAGSSAVSIPRRTWSARYGGISGPIACGTRRPGFRAMSSTR